MPPTALCSEAAESTARSIAPPAPNFSKPAANSTAATGEARITPGFRLAARFVIHTPGPVWHGGTHGEAELLEACYRNSLRLAAANGCRSIAFPAISTGVYRYPKAEAAQIALRTVRQWREPLPEEVIFCCFSAADLDVYQELLK